MIYYDDKTYLIRNLEEKDIGRLVAAEIEQGWQATEEKYWKRLNDEKENKCITLLAEYNQSPVGYVNVYFHASAGPFVDNEYPEIVDFGVLEKCRRHGIGTKLMDVAEQIAFELSDTVCIGVGLHSGYGSAQRMYVKRGYVPDGSGVWYKDQLCGQYEECCNDDDLVLYLSKIR